MRLRYQFGFALAALLTAGLACSSLSAQNGQKLKKVDQAEAQGRRGTRGEKNGPNAPRPGANEGNGLGNANNLPPKAFERLQELPPDKQEKFLQNNQRFRSLPPNQQAMIRQRLQAWNRLTPTQQQEFRERQRVWEQMTPEQQRYVRQTLLPRWQQLPPQRKQAILQRLHELRNMSESDRQVKLNDPGFVSGLNPEDRETLGQLAHMHVGMAPDPPGM